MQQYPRNNNIIHKFVDKIMPNNCRANLYDALRENHSACLDLVCLLHTNEKNIVATLKGDRRKHDRAKMDRIS